MILIKSFWILLQILIGYNLVFPILLSIFYKIRNRRSDLKNKVASRGEADYAIIVTAYEQTQQLPDVINSLLKLNYDNYLIYVVADKCDISGLYFDSDKVILLRPEQTLASNTRSHFYAINHFKRPHERLAIIDSDNLTDSGFLVHLNQWFDAGYQAVQGLRAAKNIDTTYACLDAARDIYYHYYDGKMLFGAGSSATLSGSGMAFTTSLYVKCLGHLDITGAGFDKVLQNAILQHDLRIAFAENAIVYDEKTTGTDQLVNQRARWINTWFKYFSLGFGLVFSGIKRASWNQFLFGLVLLRPPLFIFLIISLLFFAANLLISIPVALIWLAGLMVFVSGFFIALLNSPTDKKIFDSLKSIPSFMFYQVLSLIKAKRANQISVATKHSYHQNDKA
ncbi:Glycosyltransferase, catalytic subunit of cellulose synthase and poly-beta-1,6-N-acetylglucosamine synthase [Dyadobacter koreensis]|uniref:Glycosyltransferase, catalytic subunit of cellulose synthase and poly-beta-1,6-N-acetylglucosamine synthase n=1 Tax=Dyadobacter koreensis TaxID=408657 RepID=A0A1H6V503_9BACT|nr:glycosyltransferase [Dyadobacter koreensis]SEI99663.1 Glycosyltransferase, catalytic subunit of cellulose synthase and poly-beta-1,6-N-acetylglucosamine synthase [Dyadobacter koreensis]